jgi:hypothetical protein
MLMNGWKLEIKETILLQNHYMEWKHIWSRYIYLGGPLPKLLNFFILLFNISLRFFVKFVLLSKFILIMQIRHILIWNKKIITLKLSALKSLNQINQKMVHFKNFVWQLWHFIHDDHCHYLRDELLFKWQL